MSSMTRRTGITQSLARSAVIVTLMSAPIIAAPLTLVHAQTRPAPTATNPTNEKGPAVEQRINQLHAELKITPELESKWNAVAQAMRDNAANMEKLVAEKRQRAPQNMTAVQDLQTYQEFTQTHLDGLKNLTSAFQSLYDSMSDQQKKNADEVFANFHREGPSGAPNRNG
jgi:periplasmic protein CpxP/Spy